MVKRRLCIQKHSNNRFVVKLELLTCDVLLRLHHTTTLLNSLLFFFEFSVSSIINRTHDSLICLYLSKP